MRTDKLGETGRAFLRILFANAIKTELKLYDILGLHGRVMSIVVLLVVTIVSKELRLWYRGVPREREVNIMVLRAT
jgi:hypothetical protein